MRFYFLISLAFGFVNLMATESPLGNPAEVARIFGYPASKLVAKDITDTLKEKYGNNVLSVYEYSSTDNTFARVSVVVARPGILLNEKIRARLTAALEEQAKQPEVKPNVKILQLGNGVEGFIGATGVGPGGEGWRAVVAVPQKQVDVQVSVTIPSDPPLEATSETTKYHEAVMSGGDFWIDRLSESLELGINRVLSGEFAIISAPSSSPEFSSNEPAKPTPLRQTSAVAPVAQAQKIESKESSSSSAAEAASKIDFSWWLIAGAFIIAIGASMMLFRTVKK